MGGVIHICKHGRWPWRTYTANAFSICANLSGFLSATNNAAAVSKLQFYHPQSTFTNSWKKIMSNVWPIAIIALLTIVILFYALEQCGKILKGRQGRNLNKRSPAAQQRKTSNLDTIHEQHVSPSFHSSLHHLGSLRSRKKSHFTCILEHSVWKS